ncbi:hypothetical protein BC833DRAFT_564481 [Globomyces pollinis-pini]|nr:hypothetical protein BC833DRAFT_564481 [Globomyces pollinis-pini]
MHPQLILLMSILFLAIAQTSANKKITFSFTTDVGVKYWPSDSTKQEIQFTSTNTDFGQGYFKKVDYPVILATEYALNLEELFINGTLDIQNIDIEFDVNFISDFDKKYKPFRDWGNASTPVTDADINIAMSAALKSGKDVKSVTFDSAKGIRSGFESICLFKKAVYVQRWVGSFGGKLEGSFKLLPFATATLNFSKVKIITLKGTIVRIIADKGVFDLTTELLKVDNIFSTGTINKGSLKLEGHVSSPKPTNTVTPSVTPSVGGSNNNTVGGSSNNAVGGNSTPPSGGAYFNSNMLWIGMITGWMFLHL